MYLSIQRTPVFAVVFQVYFKQGLLALCNTSRGFCISKVGAGIPEWGRILERVIKRSCIKTKAFQLTAFGVNDQQCELRLP